MKFIRLIRHEDVHDNTGTGCVMVGQVFPGGQVAYMWKGEKAVMSWALSVDVLKDLHQHVDKGVIEEFETEKYNSLRELERFLSGEPLLEIEKKIKIKYRKKENEINES